MRWLHVLGILGRVLSDDLSGPLPGTILKKIHRVSGQDLQILHEKVELYRLSIGLRGAPRRFGGEPAPILMCIHLFLRWNLPIMYIFFRSLRRPQALQAWF